MDHKPIEKVIIESIKSGDWLNIMAEGDDGAQGFMRKFIALITDSKKVFGECWVAAYREFGFKIEPQGPCGEVPPCDAMMESTERMEFCCRVFVCAGLDTYLYPKPNKFSRAYEPQAAAELAAENQDLANERPERERMSRMGVESSLAVKRQDATMQSF